MSKNNEEEEREVDPVAQRINTVLERIRRIRQPYQQRRRRIVDSILGSLEKRAYEHHRAYRYNPGLEEEESEVAKLRKEIEELRQQLEQAQRRPKPIVAIKGE